MRLDLVYAGLADAVADGNLGLTAYAFVPEGVTAPAFFPAESEGPYDGTFGGDGDRLVDVEVTCRVLVSRADDLTGHALLQRYLSPTGDESVKRAIEASRGSALVLNGACDDVHVRRWRGYRYYQHGADRYLGAELIVRVIGT